MSEVENNEQEIDSGGSGNAEKQEDSGPDTDNENKEEEIDTEVILSKNELDELKKKAEECDSVIDKLLRTRAEFQNFQKRMRKEQESVAQFAVKDLILDLLPELDNFGRAAKLAEDSKEIDKFLEGLKLIEDQLFKVLEKHGVKPIETEGKPFDPKLHEAVFEEEDNGLPHHTITEEFQRGYLLNDRIVRPSKVKVSKRTVEEEANTEVEAKSETVESPENKKDESPVS